MYTRANPNAPPLDMGHTYVLIALFASYVIGIGCPEGNEIYTECPKGNKVLICIYIWSMYAKCIPCMIRGIY